MGSFNQRARDSSFLERTKILRRIVRFLGGLSVFWSSAHFCTPAGKPWFSLHCLHSVHRGETCRGEAPPSCWRKTVLLLKSLTGAFIAALRSQTRIFPYFFQANSRRVNSRRWSGFICRTTFSIPAGVIWMLSGRFSFTGTGKSCLEHMWVADMEFAVAPEIVDSSPPKSPFSLHRKQDHASD